MKHSPQNGDATKARAPRRVLPPDVYDSIELTALAFGGIGADWLFDVGNEPSASPDAIPICVHGCAIFATDDARMGAFGTKWLSNDISQALFAAAIDANENDRAVRDINFRLNRPETRPVTFKRWARELGVVRGDA